MLSIDCCTSNKSVEMARLAIFVVAVAYLCYKFLPPLKVNNALVLVETQGLYVEDLPKLQGLTAAFRVLKNFDDLVLEDDKKEGVAKRVKAAKFIYIDIYFDGQLSSLGNILHRS